MNAPLLQAAMLPALFPARTPAVLALADGTVLHGRAVGAPGIARGEVVFNTSITGYQEILTDPSYAGQMVTLTYPHIGNVGINPEDMESARVFAAGLVIRDLPAVASNWRHTEDLGAWLGRNGVVAIADVDTRRLTRILREKGTQNGCIATLDADRDASIAAAIERARDVPSMTGRDLACEVSCPHPYEWTQGNWSLRGGYHPMGGARHRVVAYDFGTKHNILRMLAERGCQITVVPARTTAAEVMKLAPDGVFLSNGPGDPQACDYAIEAIREIVRGGTPTFGICLGHQLLALAYGGRTVKMKFGHHGANHPVLDKDSGSVLITSQNHGFSVDPESLPASVRTTHVSLFDGSLQGIACTDRPAFGFQGHPEASPGPHDVGYLFDRFARMMEKRR